MSESEEIVKVLAEMKTYFEKKLNELEQEISILRSFLKVIDDLLAEKSFRKVEIPKAIVEMPQVRPVQVMPIVSNDGVHICDLQITENELILLPNSRVKFDINVPPLKTFLIKKVLEPMQTKDKEMASKGEITPDKIISFRIETEGNYLKSLTIRNYRDERRLNELRNAIRWTLRRMYEKIS
ncbi:MAG: hypothetical protein QXG01_06595 [Candidatus Bathyarchaeia archaeon]